MPTGNGTNSVNRSIPGATLYDFEEVGYGDGKFVAVSINGRLAASHPTELKLSSGGNQVVLHLPGVSGNTTIEASTDLQTWSSFLSFPAGLLSQDHPLSPDAEHQFFRLIIP